MRGSRKERWAARAEQHRQIADREAARADALEANHNRDHAFLTQPGHLPARARQIAQTDRAMRLRQSADERRAKARELERMASVKRGDAEAKREAIREAVSAVIEPMMYVESIYGVRRVLKVNAKTLRLEGALGPVTVDKALCKIVPERCGTCRSWKAPTAPETEGECWSGDRLDGDLSKGPASFTLPTSACEAWWPR